MLSSFPKIVENCQIMLNIVKCKCIYGKCSRNLKITYKQHNCRPNDDLLLKTYKVNTRYGKRTFDYAGPRLWNAVPPKLRKEEDIDKFKKQLKTAVCGDGRTLT